MLSIRTRAIWRLAALLIGVLLLGSFGACGGTTTQTRVETVTVETPAPAPAPLPQPNRKTAPDVEEPVSAEFTSCDSNIEVRAATTTCGFAQNAFWNYWTSGESASLQVYSPATGSTFDTRCTVDGGMVSCTTSDGGAVRFPQAALDSYSFAQADAYASSHDLDPDPYATAPSTSTSPEEVPMPEVPTSGGNIPNYDNGNGYRVQCNDGMYSQSGGIQGACSGHGGVR